MALHRIGRDAQTMRDFLVAQPGGDESDDLALAMRHSYFFERSLAPPVDGDPGDLGKKRARHWRRQHTRAIRHRADGPDEILERGVLEDESGNPRIDELGDFL